MTDHDPTGRPQGADAPGGDAGADAVADLLRRGGDVEGGAPGTDAGPGDDVWQRIQAEVGDEGAAPRRRDATPRRRSASPQKRPARWPLLAAAAVGALVAWLGIQLVGLTEDEDGAIVASGELAALEESGTTVDGTAEVVTVEGERRLRVELDDLPSAGEGYLEVWLLRPDVSGMVTVGVLTGETAEFPLPPGVDLGDYPVVDISVEQVDGDPSHGGVSLVRGELDQASASADGRDGIH